MVSPLPVQGYWFRITDLGFKVYNDGVRVMSLVQQDQGYAFRISGYRFSVTYFGLELCVKSSGLPSLRFLHLGTIFFTWFYQV